MAPISLLLLPLLSLHRPRTKKVILKSSQIKLKVKLSSLNQTPAITLKKIVNKIAINKLRIRKRQLIVPNYHRRIKKIKERKKKIKERKKKQNKQIISRHKKKLQLRVQMDC